MSRIYSIGHSTRSIEELVDLLSEFGVELLVDVRRFPGSKRHPHFAAGPLAKVLAATDVDYVHEPDLGGFRTLRPDSRNTAWRNAGFRAYADHMDTQEFREALGRLIGRAVETRTAIMCAEATPWRCHRQLIADALAVRGWEVGHILDVGKVETHRLNPNAQRLENGDLVYAEPPPDQSELFGGSEW